MATGFAGKSIFALHPLANNSRSVDVIGRPDADRDSFTRGQVATPKQGRPVKGDTASRALKQR